MKRNDIIFLLGILLLSVVLFGLLQRNKTSEKGACAVVSVQGKEYGRYALQEDGVWEITGPLGTNLLEIKDGSARMEAAVCPDHYCIRQGVISKTGEQIICLPNSIIVEIVGGEETDLDAVVP